MFTRQNPKVIVLMPVYNGEKYLNKSIDSILEQTFKDFEFLIINDGSTDRTVEILKSYDDPRINIINNKKNIGLTKSLNKGLQIAKGEYIARQDADDVSFPNRLQIQVDFMDSHQEVGICGTWAKIVKKYKKNIRRLPTSYEDIKAFSLFKCTLVHTSVIMRLSMLKRYNLYYNNNFITCQDYELWQRCIVYFSIRNIPKVLVMRRDHPRSILRRNPERLYTNTRKIHELILKRLNINISIDTLNGYRFEKNTIKAIHQELNRLLEYNKNIKLYSEKSLKKAIYGRWFDICYYSTILGFWSWKKYWSSPLRKNIFTDVEQTAKFIIKCLLKI